MRPLCFLVMLVGCAPATPVAPVCVAASMTAQPAVPPTPPVATPFEGDVDFSWIARATRVTLRHSTGGLMSSELEVYELHRPNDGDKYYGVAMTGGRDMTGKYTATMRKVEIPVRDVSAALGLLVNAERGKPDTRTIIVDTSDTYLAWTIVVDGEEECTTRIGCHPLRSIRFTAQPDGSDFYYWYAWNAVTPLALDRKRPDAAAKALLALFTRP